MSWGNDFLDIELVRIVQFIITYFIKKLCCHLLLKLNELNALHTTNNYFCFVIFIVLLLVLILNIAFLSIDIFHQFILTNRHLFLHCCHCSPVNIPILYYIILLIIFLLKIIYILLFSANTILATFIYRHYLFASAPKPSGKHNKCIKIDHRLAHFLNPLQD